MILATVTGIAQLDPILAALVGINILWSGWVVLRQSVIGLMDVAVHQDLAGRDRAVSGRKP